MSNNETFPSRFEREYETIRVAATKAMRDHNIRWSAQFAQTLMEHAEANRRFAR